MDTSRASIIRVQGMRAVVGAPGIRGRR
uniref:Uncharacterized protein n=1 Tax=Arundo donax TaxID=35708 RepID=A0A0A9FHA8_ARUDO